MSREKEQAELEEYLGRIKDDVTNAVAFVNGEFQGDFEVADRYYNGEVDLPSAKGRSAAVSTQVRDAIRNMRPSILRVLCGNREQIVKYKPSAIKHAAAIRQQTAYVHQLFWRSGGYMVLYQMIDESLRHRFGPVKTFWDANPTPVFSRITGLTLEEVGAIANMPGIEVLDVFLDSLAVGTGAEADDSLEGESEDDASIPMQMQKQPEPDTYTLEIVKTAKNGRIRMEAVPYGEFFIDREAQSIETARVHGHRRSTTVAEALEMGIDYDEWDDLDDLDPQAAEVAAQATAKRGYNRNEQVDRGDDLSKTFLLTEAYVKLDLLDSGYEQTYCLYLGGTAYKLLDWERIEESPFDIGVHDIRTFSPFGYSVPDVTMPSQDVITSLLRGMLDNVHAANKPRLGANPSHVNFDDLLNHSLGHPLRFKTANAQVQVIQVPSQIQQALPMLAWLEQDAQNKIGVTKAAQGLDPNAMQSTDKDAVRNTIQLSQGQVELAVRNLIETAVISIFRKLLRLSIQHLDREQIIHSQGMLVPVDQMYFDPNCYAEPMVGLGTVDQAQRMVGLQATLQQQMAIMDKLGMDNPFVTGSHIYNTIEDLTRMYGLDDVGRYFNAVTPEGEAAFTKKKAEAAAKAAPPPPDPTSALIQIEGMKQQTEQQKNAQSSQYDSRSLALEAIKLSAQDDLARDKLAQDRVIALADIFAKTGIKIDETDLKREQEAARKAITAPAASGAGSPNPASDAMNGTQ